VGGALAGVAGDLVILGVENDWPVGLYGLN